MRRQRLLWTLVPLLLAAVLATVPGRAHAQAPEIALTSPVPGSILDCGLNTFNWSGPGEGTYALHVGSAPRGTDYRATSTGTNRTLDVTTIPVDGSAVYVTLWHKPLSASSFSAVQDAEYSACTISSIALTSPEAGLLLACGVNTFNWSGPGEGTYALHVGSAPRGTDYRATSTGTNRTLDVTSIPVDGSAVFVTLWHKPQGGSYFIHDEVTFEACSPQLTSPSIAGYLGEGLPCGAVPFEWSGEAVGTYALHLGSTPGGTEFQATAVGSERSLLAHGLPSDGSTVHVRLWHRPIGGVYTIQQDTTFSACLDGSALCAAAAFTVDLSLGQTPTEGDDVIKGTSGDDVIDALGGNDIICAGDGDDVVLPGSGADRVYGGDGDDTVELASDDGVGDAYDGGQGTDTVNLGHGPCTPGDCPVGLTRFM